MKVPKIIEAARAMALENLVPPEITAITRDNSGHIQLWWNVLPGKTASQMANDVYNRLKLSTAGHWLVDGGNINCALLGRDIGCKYAICRSFESMVKRQGSISSTYDENAFTNSSFVSGLLKKIFDGPQPDLEVQQEQRITAVIGDKYVMKTIYRVDGIDFEDVKQAEDFIKGAKLFDIICENEPDADFLVYQTAIETLLKNSDKVINILQGKK